MDRLSSPRFAPDVVARKILIILVSDFNVRAGEPLPIQNLSAGWHQRHCRQDDFETGIQYAIGHGWIAVSPGGTCQLTEKGFAAA
jgi:hypothetical protein